MQEHAVSQEPKAQAQYLRLLMSKNAMKRINQYITPQSTLMEVRFEGALCTSSDDPDSPSGSMEGYEGKDEFAGWGF